MAAPKRRRRFLLGWSVWRRAHEVAAARYRAARRSHRHAPAGEGPPEIAAVAAEEAYLTDEQWELVRLLLPPQRGAVGRPRPPHGAWRHTLGGQGRFFVAGDAGGVRQAADRPPAPRAK